MNIRVLLLLLVLVGNTSYMMESQFQQEGDRITTPHFETWYNNELDRRKKRRVNPKEKDPKCELVKRMLIKSKSTEN